MTDIPLQIRHEATLYLEHLASTRRFFGPSQTEAMLASPAHILFAAKAVLDPKEERMVDKLLVVHGFVSLVPFFLFFFLGWARI